MFVLGEKKICQNKLHRYNYIVKSNCILLEIFFTIKKYVKKVWYPKEKRHLENLRLQQKYYHFDMKDLDTYVFFLFFPFLILFRLNVIKMQVTPN